MAWIESHQHLEKNGKLLELAEILCVNRYQAIGHVHALWWWALDNAEDGNLKRFGNATVTHACGWTDYIKDENERSRVNEVTNRDREDCFVDALIKVGFLDRRDGGLFIHEWEKYTHRYFKSVSKSNKSRELVRERVKRFRERKGMDNQAAVTGNSEAENGNADVTQVKRDVTRPTIPYLTIPNLKDLKTIVRSDPSFETFWTEYPKKTGKGACRTFWRKLKPTADLQKTILDSLKAHKESEGWLKENGDFIPNPLTWLHQQRWEDEVRKPLDPKEKRLKEIELELERKRLQREPTIC